MKHYPLHLLQLIEMFKKLPGVGTKSAERFAFQLLEWGEKERQSFAALIEGSILQLKSCEECGCLRGKEACRFCDTAARQNETLCVIASPRDAFAIESTLEYKGYYHVLGGLISPLEGVGPSHLTFDQLFTRIESLGVKEVVVALDSTVEGDATALYLKKLLSSFPLTVSRLAFGMPMGSSIDYVDGGTLARAFQGRSYF